MELFDITRSQSAQRITALQSCSFSWQSGIQAICAKGRHSIKIQNNLIMQFKQKNHLTFKAVHTKEWPRSSVLKLQSMGIEKYL